jgi:TM2 domain-containing membrane protein YozV
MHLFWHISAFYSLIIGALKFYADRNVTGGILKNREPLWWFCMACCFVYCGIGLHFPINISFAVLMIFIFPIILTLCLLSFIYFDEILHGNQT